MNIRGLSYLKYVALALCVGTILPFSSFGQCNNDLFTRTYDTLLTSASFSTYNLSFPKWTSDSGLLVSVKLAAEVSSQYAFYLSNADHQPAAFPANFPDANPPEACRQTRGACAKPRMNWEPG